MREDFLHSTVVFIGVVFVFIMVIFVWKFIIFEFALRNYACVKFRRLANKEVLLGEISSEKVVFTTKSRNHFVVFGLGWLKLNPNWTTLETRILVSKLYTQGIRRLIDSRQI